MRMRIDAKGLDRGINEFNRRTLAALDIYSNSVGQKLESYAKENRKWQDRTSQARQRIFYSTGLVGSVNKIAISHGVDYGVYLELCNERRNAILLESVEVIAPEALKGLKELVK